MHVKRWQHNTTLTDIDTTNLLLQHLHHSLIVIRSDQRCIWWDDNTCVMKACAEWIWTLPIGQPPLAASSSFSDQIRDASDEITTLVPWKLVSNKYWHSKPPLAASSPFPPESLQWTNQPGGLTSRALSNLSSLSGKDWFKHCQY